MTISKDKTVDKESMEFVEDLTKKVLQINGFSDFNPVQRDAIDKGVFFNNMVVSCPTASGKTFIAEIASLYHIKKSNCNVIYTCPLRALATEHYNNFKKTYGKEFGIRAKVSVGDYDSYEKLENVDILFTTYEKLDSMMRHKSPFLNSVGLLVVDEIHEIDSDRGPTLEVVMTKLRHVNSQVKILGLSATIPNAFELAEWLDAKLVQSDWRPVKLMEGVYHNKQMFFTNDKLKLIADGIKEPMLELVNDSLAQGKQPLVFANTRKNSVSAAKKMAMITRKYLSLEEKKELEKASVKILGALESPTAQCKQISELVLQGTAFHNAGLMNSQRQIIEDLFRKGILKSISSTPTLAAGINLPAFRVIITSLSRYGNYGMESIPVREYKQQCLPYNERVITDCGILEIGNIVENKKNCKVLSYNENTEKLEFNKISKYYKNKSKKIIEIESDEGYNLKLTNEHPVFVNGCWKNASELVVGDEITISLFDYDYNKIPTFFEFIKNKDLYVANLGNMISDAKSKFNLTDKNLAEKLGVSHKIIYHYKNNIKKMPLRCAIKLMNLLGIKDNSKIIKKVKTKYGTFLNIDKKIDEDVLWLAGIIATDGNIQQTFDKRTNSEYVKIRVFNTNKKIIDKSASILESLVDGKAYISLRDDGLYVCEIGNTLLAKIFRNHFGLCFKKKTTKVRVPKFLFEAPLKLVGAYFAGIFDGDGNFNLAKQRNGTSDVCRILFATASKEYAHDLQKLLLRFGIIANITKKEGGAVSEIKGKKVLFSNPTYNVVFRKKKYIESFSKYVKPIKYPIKVRYSEYNSLNKHYNKRDKFVKLVIAKKLINYSINPVNVYNIQVENNENYFANNILVHNCGRAGRPKYHDEFGQSVVITKSEKEMVNVFNNYIYGQLENIDSKLSIEPILRFHTLSIIADGLVDDMSSLENFYSKTFYAHTYQDLGSLMRKLKDILKDLQLMEFIKMDDEGKEIKPTFLGRRVAQLLLDPVSAHDMISALKFEPKFKANSKSYLFAISNTSEMFPYIRAQKKNQGEVYQELTLVEDSLFCDIEKLQYEDMSLLDKFNTTLALDSYINETTEQKLMDFYNLAPGILKSKVDNADWLLYSLVELSKIIGTNNHISELEKMRVRLKYGIKEELINLVSLKGIGRVRARSLFNAGFKSVNDLVKGDASKISSIIGSKVAESLFEQIGKKFSDKDLVVQAKKIDKKEDKKEVNLFDF